jgi:pimeloyl-ACP methyl ester carboxylesterase
MSDMSVQWVVVLVHGTWDTRAHWTRKNSRICHYIQTRFSGVCFNRLVWTGENNCQARWKAADRLENRLYQLRRAHPTAKLIILAHSHGGNIALYACRRHDVDAIVDGVVCFGSPFISAKAEAVYGDMPLALFTTGALASLASIHFAPMALASIVFYTITLLSLGTITRRSAFRRDRGLYYDLDEAEALCDRLTIKEPPSTSLLILTTEGDEASVALAV